MIEVAKNSARQWSRMGARATYGWALFELAKQRDDFYVITADLAQSSGLSRFKNEFSERLVNVGIAEQNMVGMAAGLAKDGTTVFCSSFSPFAVMRAADQIRMNMGYMQFPIRIVGLGSGLIMGELGGSHFGIEDASVMRAIPGITVIEPCDGMEIVKAVEKLCDYKKPAYLRLTGGPNLPIIYNDSIEFEIGKAILLQEGNDIALVATGTMVHYALMTAKILSDEGISAEVIDMHTIKPLDNEILEKQLNKRLIVTIEEASVIGGLGSAVAEAIAIKKNKPMHLILGINDFFPHGGKYGYLLKECELTAEHIAKKITEVL